MKMQIQQQQLRIRLSESELEQLLVQRECMDETKLPDGGCHQRYLQLSDQSRPSTEFLSWRWSISVPHADFIQFVDARPRRDSLQFVFDVDGQTTLIIDLEIDVRDSRRKQVQRRSNDDSTN